MRRAPQTWRSYAGRVAGIAEVLADAGEKDLAREADALARKLDGLARRAADDFRPGEVIVRRLAGGGIGARYRVMDPPRTSRGKLRLENVATGSVMTTWWDRDRGLPPRYELDR